MKVLITKKEANRVLRKAGFSIFSSKEKIEKLEKIADGKREKVRLRDVEGIINIAAAPVFAPVDPAKAKRLRRYAKMQGLSI